jgi:hypothetical protein
MALTDYTYSIAGDTLNGVVDGGKLFDEIVADPLIIIAPDRVDTADDVLSVWMKDALSAPEEAALTVVVAAHDGVVVPKPDAITTLVEAADGTPVITDRSLRLGRESLKLSGTGTENMNVDGRPAGTPVVLWNGTGAGDTDGDWTPGDTGSETPESAHAGTNGWDTGVAALNNITRFDAGSPIDVDSLYQQLQFWIQPKAFPTNSWLQIGFLDAANNLVGNLLRVEQYASNMDLDTWQQVAIPIVDFGLTAPVQRLVFRYRVTDGQHHWFDDIELVPDGGGGPYRFGLAAPAGERWHMSMLVLQVVAPETGWNHDSFASIAGGLTNGLLLRHLRRSTGETLWKFATKDNRETFGQYHPQESFAFADGTLLLGFMVKPGKASVVVTEDDVLEFVVRDDLSSIPDIRAYLHYGVEEVS